MAEKNVNHIDNFIYFFTPLDQKAPTKNPNRPNLFNILSATTNLVKDNLFNDAKEGFKFKTPEDFQVEVLIKWDKDKSFEKNNKKNQDYYLGAIRRIRGGDESFIKKCSDSGVSKERIDKIKKIQPLEYVRLETTIRNEQVRFVPLKINPGNDPQKDIFTEADVKRKDYEDADAWRKAQRLPRTSSQKLMNGLSEFRVNTFDAAIGFGGAIKDGAKSAGKAVVRVLDGDSNVNSWRVRDSEDTYDGGLVLTKNFHLLPTASEMLCSRAAPASMAYSKRDARNDVNKDTTYGNPSTYVQSLLKGAKKDEEQLKQLYGSRNGDIMFKRGNNNSARGGGR